MEQIGKLSENFRNLFFFLPLIYLSVFSNVQAQESSKDSSEVSHTFYILSDTGPGAKSGSPNILKSITEASKQDKSASLLLLGNFSRNTDFSSNGQERANTKEYLQHHLLDPLKAFNGNVIFVPGENEWSKGGPKALEFFEDFLQENANAEFLPDDGCPVEEFEVNDEVVLITVDSQWYLEDWDKSSDFNQECDIRDRERFFEKIKDDIKDNHGKLKIVAVHHPVLSSAPGFFQRVFPLSSQNFENPKYRGLRKRLETLASQFDDVIFVSGNHRSLQYLDNDRNPQIISATAADSEVVKAEEGNFASGAPGYSRLRVFKNGNSEVEFFKAGASGSQLLFSKKIEKELGTSVNLTSETTTGLGKTYSAAIYSPQETKKSGLHRILWGDNYREVYSKKVEVPILFIDSLDSSLRPIKEGGGQQSRSLRFINDNGNEYTLRALRKDPIRYLQADISPETYLGDLLDSTVAHRVILDFFTTSHPYGKFAIDNFAEALELPHIAPEIYYVPKQPALGIYNDEYGNALFEMQVHAGEENKDFEQFRNPDNIISTYDLLEELREDKNVVVDESAYIKARLLDMLVGDWDRHQDQWRWAEREEEGMKRYIPIPRDRDQAFSKYDGAIVSALKLSVPLLRKMQTFDEDIKNIKWFNWSGYPLDLQLLYKTTWSDWEEQVKMIQHNITDEQIELAFNELPKDAQDQSIEEIKEKLRSRRQNLRKIARAYFERIQEFKVITGTGENDDFEVVRQENGSTEISQKIDGEEIFRHSYNSGATEEIWIYGLDGEDKFTVSGRGSDAIKLRILGGPENDTYDFQNKRQVKLYDFRSTENTILQPGSRRLLVDSYEINSFHYQKFKHSIFKVLPYVNFETDAGFTLGVRNIWTRYGLVNNPFQARHELLTNYYFDTNGYAIRYNGEFAHLFYNLNLGIDARLSSPNYTLNYFGTGNETENPADVPKEFNRVRIEKWHFAPSLIWRNEAGSTSYFKAILESNKVKYEGDTFLGEVLPPENDIFDAQLYAGAEANYHFYSKNNKAFPNLGSDLSLTTGYKTSIDGAGNEFGYLEPVISFNHPLISSGYAVFATKIGGKAIVGDNYEIYHAATLGGNRSLRGYRNHRFIGKQAFYHSTDLRTALGIWRNSFLPIVYGVTAGFDYGRVWTPGEDSEQWHNNYGGSIWISAGLAVTGTIGIYRGGDGNRLAVTLNFKY